jgi:hypothetical protein
MGKFENITSSAIDLVHISDVLDNLGIFIHFLFSIMLFIPENMTGITDYIARQRVRKALSPVASTSTTHPPPTPALPAAASIPSIVAVAMSVCLLTVFLMSVITVFCLVLR